MNKHIIRHSDIQTFLRCRNLWDFSSPIREGYKPRVVARELDIGTSWAAAMEAYYDPITWGSDHRFARAFSAFIASCEAQREVIYANSDTARVYLDEEINERIALGKGMLSYFFGWSKKNDGWLEPKRVEWEFEVPILHPSGFPLKRCPHCFMCDSVNVHLHTVGDSLRLEKFKLEPVVFQGRIDRLFWDKVHEGYWLGEDKTAAQFVDADWLVMDPQTSRYMWALKESDGIDCFGMIWTQAKKAFPESPKILKDGTVSVDKQQCTTAALFAKAVLAQHGSEPDARGAEDRVPLKKGSKKYLAYEAFHAYLVARERADANGSEPWLIRRVVQPISPEITAGMNSQLYTLASEMLNSPAIYPTVTSFNCGRCPYKEPCIIRHEGHDWRWSLDAHFIHIDELKVRNGNL